MTQDDDNPYAAPADVPDEEVIVDETNDIIAGRLTRLGAAIIDGLLIMVIVMPIYFVSGFMQRAAAQQVGVVEQIGMSLLGLVVMLLLNGYSLIHRGQTVGKILAKIQIVDFQSGQLLPFVRVYVLRYLWTLPITVVVLLIPGAVDDLLLNAAVLIDSLMIFGKDRRCLHDFIAGSKVVAYRQNRSRLA